MTLIQNSKDILYLVISFCVLWLTIFFAWFIYYLIMIMREMFKATREMRERVHRIDEVMKAFKEKIEHSTSYLLLIGEGMKKLVELAKSYTQDGKKKRK